MMILKLFLVLALAVVSQANKAPAFVSSKQVALDLRGGGAIGPLDKDMASKVAQLATTAYIGGSASKFIAEKTGGTAPKVKQSLLFRKRV